MISLAVRLLGTFEVALEGEPVTAFAADKIRALLAYLVTTPGQPHRREFLAGLLWPDYPEKSARASLRNALASLRRAIDDHGANPHFLQISSQSIQWNVDSDYWLDVATLSTLAEDDQPTGGQMEEVLALYQGQFLEGFSIPDSAGYEEWLLFKREELERLVVGIRRKLIDLYEQSQEYEKALAHAWHQVEIEPWREEAHRQLMRLLALAGQRGAALAQYDACRQALADELGVEPGEETEALYERIRRDALKPPEAGTELRDVEPRPPGFLDPDADLPHGPLEPFVGREDKLARLDGFLSAAIAGQGRIAFVSGEAGWGKTRLLAEFSRRAQERYPDLIVVSGLCTAFTETGDPYLPFREILGSLCADVEQGWADGRVTQQHALRLWRILPQMINTLVSQGRQLVDTFVPGEALLARAAAHPGVDPSLLGRLQAVVRRARDRHQGPTMDQERLFQEVAGVLRSISGDRPLLVILDDLHWADNSSLGLLFHLGRRLAHTRILIVGAYRPEDVSLDREGAEHPLASILAEFKRLCGDIWVHLGQDATGGRDFVDPLLDSEPNQLADSFRQQLARTTKGHPLFTVEMLRNLKEIGGLYRDQRGRWQASSAISWDALPRRVEGVIERRVNRLAAGPRRALAVASVEGEEFTAEVVARVCNIDEADMVRLLSGSLAKQHRLVQARGARRTGGQRVSLYQFSHNLFQTYLFQNLDPVERTYLHEAVGTALEAVFEDHTGEIAARLARHFQEAGHLRKAIRYLTEAGDAAAQVYADLEAIAHYEQAIELALELQADSEDLTALYRRLGRTLELDSQFDRALAIYQEMEALAQERGDQNMELASLMARATIQAVPTAVHRADQARSLGQRALSLASKLGDRRAEAKILWILSLANYFTDRLPEAIDCSQRSLGLSRELGLREQTARTLNDLGGIIYLYSGQVNRATESLEQAADLWRELGNRRMLADSLGGLCVAHVFAGEYDRAIALSEEALQISQAVEDVWGQSYSRWTIGDAYQARGEYSRSIEVSEECMRLGKTAGFLASQVHTRTRLATVYADLGLVDRGIEMAKSALALADAHDFRIHVTLGLGILAHLHVLKDDPRQAEALIAEGKKDAYRESWAIYYLAVLRAEAELALRQAEHQRALAVTEDLIGALRQSGMHSGLPEALYLQGQALLGLRQEQIARVRLQEARSEAEAMGSRRFLWRILHALSQVEEDPEGAERLRQRARETIDYIARHIYQPGLRASFLSLPSVEAVCETAEPECQGV